MLAESGPSGTGVDGRGVPFSATAVDNETSNPNAVGGSGRFDDAGWVALMMNVLSDPRRRAARRTAEEGARR